MSRRLLLFVLLLGITLAMTLSRAGTTQPAKADYDINPPSQPGFPQVLSGANVLESPPTLVDLDGDPATLEIVFGSRDRSGTTVLKSGIVYAYRPNGQLYWETPVRAPIQGSVAAVDIDDDGVTEVLVPLGGYVDSYDWHGGLIALNGRTGAVEWIFDTDDWLFQIPDGYADGVFSSPAVGDLDADGDLEIVFGAWDMCIYALDHHGNPIWPELNGMPGYTFCGGHGFYNEDTVWGSPALADLTNDGYLEIVIGSGITTGNRHDDPSGGYLYVLDRNGNQLAREWMSQRVQSSPAIADLEGDGLLEVAVGSGTNLPNTGYWVKVFNYNQDLSDIQDRLATRYSLPTLGRVFSSPSIVDVNDDGLLDIVAISNIGDGPEQGASNLGSQAYAWSGENGAQLWTTPICDSFNNSWATHSSPTIAEVGRSGDTGLKVLFSHSWEVGILNAVDGSYYTDPGSDQCGTSGTTYCTGYPHTTDLTYFTNYTTVATPAVGDIDSDGLVEVVVAGGASISSPTVGMLYVWEPGREVGDIPWPQFRFDAYNSGNAYVPPRLSVPLRDLAIWMSTTDTLRTMDLPVVNASTDNPITWEASADEKWLSVFPTRGSTTDTPVVTVTVDRSGLQAGSHYGNVVIQALTPDGVVNPVQTVTIEVKVGDWHFVYLPSALR